jgi:hypothetical protein
VTQRTTTVSLGLFAAWACHDLEELFTMRETTRMAAARMPDWVPIPDDVRQDGLSHMWIRPKVFRRSPACSHSSGTEHPIGRSRRL